MKILKEIINDLESLPNNPERKKYLISVITDPNVPRGDLRRFVCREILESDFLQNVFRPTFLEIVKMKIHNLKNFLKR